MGIANRCTPSQMDCIERRAHALEIARLNVIAITPWAKWPNGGRNWHARAIYAAKIPRYSQLDHEHVSGPVVENPMFFTAVSSESGIPGLAAGLVNASLK